MIITERKSVAYLIFKGVFNGERKSTLHRIRIKIINKKDVKDVTKEEILNVEEECNKIINKCPITGKPTIEIYNIKIENEDGNIKEQIDSNRVRKFILQ